MNKLVYLGLSILDISKTYPYPTNVVKVRKKENLNKYKWLIFIIILVKTERPYMINQSVHIFQIIYTEY